MRKGKSIEEYLERIWGYAYDNAREKGADDEEASAQADWIVSEEREQLKRKHDEET